MSTICAETASELCTKLKNVDGPVPLRPEGRKSQHMEVWTSCRLLSTISQTELLDYPLTVEHTDRPDFVLSLPSGRIGMEVTEAVFKDQARVEAYSDKRGISILQHIPYYRVGNVLRSKDEIGSIARGQARSFPRSVNSIRRNWIGAVLDSAKQKAQKFEKPGFRCYDCNWLLIYDNLTSLVVPTDEYIIASKLGDLLFNCSWSNPFDKVFVHRPENILEFAANTAPVRRSVSDRWR